MNRWAVRGFGVLALLLGACLLVPGASHAATIEVGWWWRANTGTSPPTPALPVVPAPQVTLPAEPPPPPAPPNADGGLQVAALPDGALAIAAVRVDQELTSLTLRVAPNGDANGMSASLAACAAAAPWEPAIGGRWDAKPVVACDLINGGGSVAGIRSDDGSAWTFPVAPIVGDGVTDVVIVPLADGELGDVVVTPFQVVFVPPTADDMVVAPVDEPRASPDEEVTDELFEDPAAYEEFTSFGGSSSVAAPEPAVRPALGADEQAPVLPGFAGAGDPDNSSQVFGALAVLFGIGALLWASRQPTPVMRSLVRGGREIPGIAPQFGGLGRFSRVREGKPPPLQ